MAIFLGIDGGGSKTACVVGDENTALGRAVAGGSNPVRVGDEQARTALRNAISAACDQAKVRPEQIVRTCIGIAGASVPQTRSAVQRILSECLAGEILIAGDMEIAFHAALGSRPGVVVIAGTGSIAFGRDSAGRTARAGGWGYAISDEGSGHWIGRRAVAAITQAHDTCKRTALEGGILNALQIGSFEELIRIANATPSPDFARLFPPTLTAADAGDEFARIVLNDAGSELARLADTVATRLWPEGQNVRVALVGGVFQHSALVRMAFWRALRALRRNVCVSFAIADPVCGALAMARRLEIQAAFPG